MPTARDRPPHPWCVVVAGVTGAGKSTVAQQLAAATGAELADGDDFHTPQAVATMRSGAPLTDADRAPWLESIGVWIDQVHRRQADAVISCSALRRSYRDALSRDRPWVRFCLLDVPVETLRSRVSGREGHFMPASQLPDQLALLEPLAPDEAGIVVDGSGSPQDVAQAALRAWGLREET